MPVARLAKRLTSGARARRAQLEPAFEPLPDVGRPKR